MTVRPGRGVGSVITPQAGQAVADELAADLRTRIARFKVPRRFAFVERLPRTATGKLAKHRLVHKQPDEIGRCLEFTVRSARARSADASIPAG